MLDYINLSAHYACLLLGTKDEEAVLRARGYTEAQINSALSDKPKTSFEINGLKFSVPMTRFKDDSLGYLLLLLEQYDKGNLPFEGPITEQPAQVIEIFELLKRTKSYILNREQKRQEGHGRHNKGLDRASRRGSTGGSK